MADETVLQKMERILKKAGYKVNLRPQESLSVGELVIVFGEIDLPVETSKTYMMSVSYRLQWLISNIHDIPEEIVRLVTILETSIQEPTFKVDQKPEIKLLGEWYRVSITVSCKDRVVIV